MPGLRIGAGGSRRPLEQEYAFTCRTGRFARCRRSSKWRWHPRNKTFRIAYSGLLDMLEESSGMRSSGSRNDLLTWRAKILTEGPTISSWHTAERISESRGERQSWMRESVLEGVQHPPEWLVPGSGTICSWSCRSPKSGLLRQLGRFGRQKAQKRISSFA